MMRDEDEGDEDGDDGEGGGGVVGVGDGGVGGNCWCVVIVKVDGCYWVVVFKS
jgi:hypothetical protein